MPQAWCQLAAVLQMNACSFAAIAVATLVSSPALAYGECSLPGSQAVAHAPGIKYILVGELHGTDQGPALFGELLCSLASGHRKIAVALEFFEDDQGWIDRYMASDGGEAAVRKFVNQPRWATGMKTGQTSVAMLMLLDRLRLMKQRGQVVDVRAFIPPSSGGPADYERTMASGVVNVSNRWPGATVIVLLGNAHASKQPITFDGVTYRPAAMSLPMNETLSLYQINKPGEAWNCRTVKDCGPSAVGGDRSQSLGIHLKQDALGYDGVLASGVPASASPPAATSRRN